MGHAAQVQLLTLFRRNINGTLSQFMNCVNDDYTRASIATALSRDIQHIQSIDHRLIYDYKVVCDQTNNPIDSSMLHVDIYVQLHGSVDFFTLNATVGESFDSMVAQLADAYERAMNLLSKNNNDNY